MRDGTGLRRGAAHLNAPTTPPSLLEMRPQKRGRTGRKSLYRGVSFYRPTGCWLAQVSSKGKRLFLGNYKLEDEEMAAKAFDKAAIKIRGKDADTNFPHEEYAEEMRSRGASKISVEEFILQLRSDARRQNELR